jgi:hypothetical protein
VTSPAELQAIRERLNTKSSREFSHLYDALALLALYDAQSDEVRRLREALELHRTWEALPTDRGGKYGPKGRAYAAFIAARDAALGSQP